MKTISGLVKADGTLSQGSGVTVMHVSSGTYLLRFAAGTWPSFPTMVVSPFGLSNAFPVAEVNSILAPGDGSAAVLVLVSSTAGTFTPTDGAFLFTATAT